MFFYPAKIGRVLLRMITVCFAIASAPVWSSEGDGKDLYTSPAKPIAGQTFTMSFDSDACQIFLSEGPLDRTVEVQGSTVRVTVEYFQNQICVPYPTETWTWSIGPLAAGNYTLMLVGEEPFEGGGTIELEQIPLKIVTPIASMPSVVPANDPLMLLLLGLSLATCALPALRSRR